jgi:hypothetical protein
VVGDHQHVLPGRGKESLVLNSSICKYYIHSGIHGRPSQTCAAKLVMNLRCRARNSTTVGIVISVA